MRKFKTILLISFLSMGLSSIAQDKICFAYDEAGNRVKREIVITRGAKAASKSPAKRESYYDMLGDRTVKISSDLSGIINVSVLNMGETDEGFIEVYSIDGMQVFKQNISSVETFVDISSQPHGVYILRVTVNGIPTTWKITKK